MKKFLIFPLISILLFSGCTIQKNGDDLTGFIFRMNEKNESYALTTDGFLYSDENNNYYKFFLIDESEILLSFNKDNKGRLIEMSIVLSEDFYNNNNICQFIDNSLYCFINDDNSTAEALESIDFYNAVKTTTKETLKTKNGNIEILLDVTEIGTVITVYKDI